MEVPEIVSLWLKAIGSLATVSMTVAGAWWTYDKWRRRDEHFPRIELETSVNFVGRQNGQIVCELVAFVENKGVVPLKYKKFTFSLRGLKSGDELALGGVELRDQLNFAHKLASGSFVPEEWQYSYIYPGIRTEYSFVTTVVDDISFVRMKADLEFLNGSESHHAARVLKVPEDV